MAALGHALGRALLVALPSALASTLHALPVFVVQYAMNAAWQVPLIALVACVAAWLLRRDGPAREHGVWTSALWLSAVLPLLSQLAPTRNDILSMIDGLLRRHDPAAGAGNVTVHLGPARGLPGLVLDLRLLTAVSVAFCLVSAYFAARLAWSMRRTRQMVRGARPMAFDATMQARWDALCRRLALSPLLVAESVEVSGPVIVGVQQVWMLLPSGFVDALSPEQLNAAFAHELAHAKRHDFALHLAAQFVALPLRWHPLTGLLLSRMEQTREAACDAMAAAVLDGPRSYARSLVDLASLIDQRTANPSQALGLFEGGAFERRIMQLTHVSRPLSSRQRVLARTAVLALFAAVCASALAVHTGVSVPQEPAAGPATGASPLTIRPGIMAGQMVTKVSPVYPPDAKAAKIQGTVVLKAIIGKSGAIENLTVVSGPEELQAATIDAVKQWVYKPYLLNGNPVEVTTEIRVTYSLAQ